MLQKSSSIHDKIAILEKTIGLVFNNAKIGIIAKQVINSLEFKENAQIIDNLSNGSVEGQSPTSTIISTMLDTLKKDLQIEWNTDDQNTFYTILTQIFKHNQTDINVLVMNNIATETETDDIKGLEADKRKGILVLGGSYNPCHTEHVELLNEIKDYLEKHENFSIIAAYLVVTSDGYVIGKLKDAAIKFKHRHKICELTAAKYDWCHPSHIPMVSAKQYARMITMRNSFGTYFGTNKSINASELHTLYTVNCCGADKVSASWLGGFNNMYDSRSMTACIARKGYNEDIKEAYEEAKANGECNGFVYVSVECKPISSTLIRKHLFKLRDKLCDKIKGTNEWKLKKRVSNKYKQNFRNNVKNMLCADVIEYLIDNIDDLWIVPKGKVVGGGKPHNVVTNSARKKKHVSKKKRKWWSFK